MDEDVSTPAQVARARVTALAEEFERRHAPETDAGDDPGFGLDDEPDDPRPRFRWSLDSGHLRVVAALLGVAVVGVLWWIREPGGEEAVPTGSPVTVETAEAPAEEVVVHVGGKVAEPGIVTLPAGARVVDAVEAAGGADDDTDLGALNLARPVNDGEQILVGVDRPESAPAAGDGTAGGGPLSLNQASAEQLQGLPGVGPVTAEAIVRWREENGGFAQVEDLLEVRGIGEARLAELRDLVTP